MATASEQELKELEKILTRWNASFDAVRPIFDAKEKQYEKYRFKRDPGTHTYKYNVKGRHRSS